MADYVIALGFYNFTFTLQQYIKFIHVFVTFHHTVFLKHVTPQLKVSTQVMHLVLK